MAHQRPLRNNGEAGGIAGANVRDRFFLAFSNCPDGHIRLASRIGKRTSPFQVAGVLDREKATSERVLVIPNRELKGNILVANFGFGG
jgi:hypothetical protein